MTRTASLAALALALAPALALLAAPGCARDPRQVAWDDAFAAELAAPPADPAAAAPRLIALAARAPRPVDAAAADFAAADALLAGRRPDDAVRVWLRLAADAPRRDDRARAHYVIARFAEDTGRVLVAVHSYRRLVLTYPDLMPGERALAHLERIFTARGERGVDAHLTWTRAAYPHLAHTSLADNLLYFPARLAHARFAAHGDAQAAALAEALYVRIDHDHPRSGLWNDAWWQRSLLYHAQGRYADEIAAIARLQRTYEKLSLFGHDDHPYFWQGQLRIARLELLHLGAPRAAAASYQRFVDRYPDSRWRDDALFWRGCALLQAGDPARAEQSFARLAALAPDSKYLRRLDAARRDPRSPACVPRDFVAGEADAPPAPPPPAEPPP